MIFTWQLSENIHFCVKHPFFSKSTFLENIQFLKILIFRDGTKRPWLRPFGQSFDSENELALI